MFLCQLSILFSAINKVDIPTSIFVIVPPNTQNAIPVIFSNIFKTAFRSSFLKEICDECGVFILYKTAEIMVMSSNESLWNIL